MDQYPVPQFIEKEGNIVFFLSFRQFFYLVGAGVISFFMYYLLPFPLFIVGSLVVGGGAVGLAFVKINGVGLGEMVMNSLGFAMGGRNYVWKKKESPAPFKPIQRTRIQKIDKGPVLQAQPSQLKKTKTAVELRTK